MTNALTDRTPEQAIQRVMLTRHPILRAIHDVMQAIEACGASPELTRAVILAGRLSEPAATILDAHDAALRLWNEAGEECQKAQRLWHAEAIRAEKAETASGGLRRAGEILLARAELAEHQLITCGVAATHPDAGLTLTGAYKDWDSPQAEDVRKLRATTACVRGALIGLLNAIAGADLPIDLSPERQALVHAITQARRVLAATK